MKMGLSISVGRKGYYHRSYFALHLVRNLAIFDIKTKNGVELNKELIEQQLREMSEERKYIDNKDFPQLLHHSDCDGEYSPKEARELLKELNNIGIIQVIDELRKACKASIRTNKPIVFG